MSSCKRAHALFGPCWDDEITLAEREWLEGHLGACPACREGYEEYSRTLELVGGLPRHEAREGLVEDTLARVRRATPAPDVIGPRRIFVDERPGWIPVAAAAGVVLLAFAAVVPWLAPRGPAGRGSLAVAPPVAQPAPVVQPRLVSVPAPASTTPAAGVRRDVPAATATAVATDSLFDHSEDVEFILDPVTLRRGRAHTVSRLPQGIQGEQAVITF